MAVDLDSFQSACKAYGLPPPTPELRFHDKRRWRFDYAYPDIMLAIEIEGGIWMGGRHTQGGGYMRDCEKYNEAQILGWKVLRFVPSQIKSGGAFGTLARAINAASASRVVRELRADSGVGANLRRSLSNPLFQAPDPKPLRHKRTRAAKVHRQDHGREDQAGARPDSQPTVLV